MSGRVAVGLTLLAAVALTVAPVRALQHGVVEWLGLVRVAAVLIAAWGVARGAAWARWLLTLLAVLMLWAAWRAWTLPVDFRALIPDYPLWRAGRGLGALFLAGAAAAAWGARDAPPRTA
jgi:hypothetical protein